MKEIKRKRAPNVASTPVKLQFKSTLKSKDTATRSILEFFSQENSKKRRRVDDSLRKAKQGEEKAFTVIPYRDDGGGKGAYHDHYTTQLLTQQPTTIATTVDKPIFSFTEHLRTVTHDLSFGALNKDSRHVPPLMTEVQDRYGLLLIPGAARTVLEGSASDYKPRGDNETALLKRAALQGQPILAICAGSWTVWQHFGGKLKDVHHHNCRAGMPRIKDSTGKIGHNVQVHRIRIDPNAHLLKAATSFTQDDTPTPTVNSVHWKAADEKFVPAELAVSARAVHDQSVSPTNLEPEADSVEAYESKHGAPILGIQWHPEAYTNNTRPDYQPEKHQNLIKYMVKAGQAFKERRKLVAELEQKHAHSLLKQTGLFSDKNDVIRTEKNSVVKFTRSYRRKSKNLRHVTEVVKEIHMKEEYLLEKGYKKVR